MTRQRFKKASGPAAYLECAFPVRQEFQHPVQYQLEVPSSGLAESDVVTTVVAGNGLAGIYLALASQSVFMSKRFIVNVPWALIKWFSGG